MAAGFNPRRPPPLTYHNIMSFSYTTPPAPSTSREAYHAAALVKP